MPSFEEEAFSRAQQMRRKPNQNSRISDTPKSAEPPKTEEEHYSPPVKEMPIRSDIKSTGSSQALESLFKDKDQSLILLLIILLMDEKSDSSLLLALMYLLM